MTEELSRKRFSGGWSGEETRLFRTIGSIIGLGGSDSTMLSIKGRLVIEAIDDDGLTLIGDPTIVNGGGESQAVVLVEGSFHVRPKECAKFLQKIMVLNLTSFPILVRTTNKFL